MKELLAAMQGSQRLALAIVLAFSTCAAAMPVLAMASLTALCTGLIEPEIAGALLGVAIFAGIVSAVGAANLAGIVARSVNASVRARVLAAVTLARGVDRNEDERYAVALHHARAAGIRREPKPGFAIVAIAEKWTASLRIALLLGIVGVSDLWIPAIFIATSWMARRAPMTSWAALARLLRTSLLIVAAIVSLPETSSEALRLLQSQALVALAWWPAQRVSGAGTAHIAGLVGRVKELEAATRTEDSTMPRSAQPVAHHEVRLEHDPHPSPGSGPVVVRAGMVTGLVGESFAAVSRQLHLAMGLRTSPDRKFIVDRRLVDEHDGTSLETVAYVAAQPMRLPVDLGQNVACRATYDDRLVTLALGIADLDRLVRELPGGLRTPLTAELRGGHELTDLQWMLMARARAAYRVLFGCRLLVVEVADATTFDWLARVRALAPETMCLVGMTDRALSSRCDVAYGLAGQRIA